MMALVTEISDFFVQQGIGRQLTTHYQVISPNQVMYYKNYVAQEENSHH